MTKVENTKLRLNKSVVEEIRKRNEAFEKADAVGKRVMIAKDVIKLLKQKRLQAGTGVFLRPYLPEETFGEVYSDERAGWMNTQFRELFESSIAPDCEVCAIGALAVSCIRHHDKSTLRDVREENLYGAIKDEGKLSHQLNDFFERDQLILIEQAFEHGDGAFKGNEGFTPDDDAVEFGRRYDDAETRLIAIMANIVKNKGQFKP